MVRRLIGSSGNLDVKISTALLHLHDNDSWYGGLSIFLNFLLLKQPSQKQIFDISLFDTVPVIEPLNLSEWQWS
jgi:hypothetical protein